jgi:hypothetical protein
VRVRVRAGGLCAPGVGDGGRAEAGPAVPQCQPGPRAPGPRPARKSRGFPTRPGSRSGRALFGFGGSAPSTPPLPGSFSTRSRTPRESVGGWGAGEGWEFPLFCRLPRSRRPPSPGRWGDRLGAMGRWGWLGNLFSPFLWVASPFP